MLSDRLFCGHQNQAERSQRRAGVSGFRATGALGMHLLYSELTITESAANPCIFRAGEYLVDRTDSIRQLELGFPRWLRRRE
jgi:hypothetical protein